MACSTHAFDFIGKGNALSSGLTALLDKYGQAEQRGRKDSAESHVKPPAVPFSSRHGKDLGEGRGHVHPGTGNKEEGMAPCPAAMGRRGGRRDLATGTTWMVTARTASGMPQEHGCPHFSLSIQTATQDSGIKLQGEGVLSCCKAWMY